MIINTEIDVKHLELIKIFIKANELVGLEVNEVPLEIRGRFHMVLQLECKFGGTAETITFMGIRHAGVLNMFDDYLLKCGVLAQDIKPLSMALQVREEREAKINEDFMKRLLEIKEQNEYSNK